MPLSALILSCDSQEVSVFECILGSLRIGVEVERDPALAWIRLNKSKVDAVIVDCDLAGAEEFLRKLQMGAEQESSPVLILSTTKEQNRFDSLGAEFVARKPISVERAVQMLSAARNLILKARLQYHRHALDTPVSITRTEDHIDACLLNLSQSGMRVHLQPPQALQGDVDIHFLLPGTEVSLDAKGRVAWADTRGNAGIRLVAMSEPDRRDLRLWVERKYFQTHGA
jgi:DNA-binding response OmpR family regulator